MNDAYVKRRNGTAPTAAAVVHEAKVQIDAAHRRPSWIAGLLMGLVGGLSAVWVDRVVLPRGTVAQIDLAGLVQERLQRRAGTDGPDSERSQDAARFATHLQRELDALATEYHVVLLAAPAVVAGAPDLTPLLRRRIEGLAP